MSRTFTKLIFAVAILFGLLSTAFAEKYKATMKLSGIATGESEDVDAEITKGDDNLYKITFNGFNASAAGEQITGGSTTITALEGTTNKGLSLKETSKSEMGILNYTLSISKFEANIDEKGNGEGSFSGSISVGFFSMTQTCEFTLSKVVDSDTIVTKALEFDNVPFYNKMIDLTKEGDTTMTNNDSTAVGIKLYSQKATFAMTDFELSIADLKFKQKLILEGLNYTVNKTTEDLMVMGTSSIVIDQIGKFPADVEITVSKDNKINGTIKTIIDALSYYYKVIVIFGSQADGVVVETKLLEYEKTDSYNIKSDEEFVFGSKIYINDSGILIENLQYSVIEQTMTLLIKDFKHTTIDEIETLENYSATKAEAYITVNDQVVYMKDVDIELDVNVTPTGNAFGALTIIDGGSNTNKFIDIDAPIALNLDGRMISMAVDTTGNELDGYTSDSEFDIRGIYDYADGYIESVKLADIESVRANAIESLKSDVDRISVEVIATDKAGNSSKIKTSCYLTVAPVSIEEKVSKISPIRVIADSLTGKATIKIESVSIEYYAKNNDLGLSKKVGEATAKAVIDGAEYDLPTTIELSAGKVEFNYVWENMSGEAVESASTITVYENETSYTGVANVAGKAVSVIYKNGNLIVNGVNDANVTIVNLSGATVYTGKAGAINLHKGIYFVKVNGKAHKLIVK